MQASISILNKALINLKHPLNVQKLQMLAIHALIISTIHGSALEIVSSSVYKYFGIWIDDKLTLNLKKNNYSFIRPSLAQLHLFITYLVHKHSQQPLK